MRGDGRSGDVPDPLARFRSIGFAACTGYRKGVRQHFPISADAVARIQLGLQDSMAIGNMDSRRDWGYAPEYVDAMWRMLQGDAGDTFVVATGHLTSVRDFVGVAFETAGIHLRWQGKGLSETGVEAETGKVRVRVSPEYFRPDDVRPLCGDPSKARRLLGWEASTGVDEL